MYVSCVVSLSFRCLNKCPKKTQLVLHSRCVYLHGFLSVYLSLCCSFFLLFSSCLVWNTKENSCNSSNSSNNNSNAVIVANPSYEENPLLYVVKCIFGYPTNYDNDHDNRDDDEQIQIQGERPPLQPLPFVITHKTPGINEFLSAMVAVKQLECHLTFLQLIQIAICIAATIPFKNGNGGTNNNDDDGSSSINNPPQTYMEFLYSNTVKVRKLLLSKRKTTTTTQQQQYNNSGGDIITNDDYIITNDQFWIETVQLATRLANAGK